QEWLVGARTPSPVHRGPIVPAALAGLPLEGTPMANRAAGTAARPTIRASHPPPGASGTPGAAPAAAAQGSRTTAPTQATAGPKGEAEIKPALTQTSTFTGTEAGTPSDRLWRQRLPAWYRACMLTVGIAATTGLTVIGGAARGFTVRESVVMALPTA